METILEQQRRCHEERERLVKLMVDEYATKKTSVSAHFGNKSHLEKICTKLIAFVGVFIGARANPIGASTQVSVGNVYQCNNIIA